MFWPWTRCFYTEESFPSYKTLADLGVRYLSQYVYDLVRERYINKPIPFRLNSKIPKKYEDLTWASYAIVRAIRYDS